MINYLISLTHFPKFGQKSILKLKKYFPDFKHAFESNIDNLIKAGIKEKIAKEFIEFRKTFRIEEILLYLQKENIKVIALDDKKYPRLLAEIHDPPELIYYKGNLSCAHEFCLSVVGARKYTNYGKRVVFDIVRGLAKNDLTIISGLALGIDALAHSATLDCLGKTIAVLGSGVNNHSIYPVSNNLLAKKIVEKGGAVISEFPIGTPPLSHHFPLRNRIIAGLSIGTLVIEAGVKSGSLITAYSALDSGREIFAVPGDIYSNNSKGTHSLLKRGAHVVTCAEDIIETLNLEKASQFIENKKIIPESPIEEKIISFLTQAPIHINDIIRETNIDTQTASATLTIMEMKGMIKNLGNMMYVK